MYTLMRVPNTTGLAPLPNHNSNPNFNLNLNLKPILPAAPTNRSSPSPKHAIHSPTAFTFAERPNPLLHAALPHAKTCPRLPDVADQCATQLLQWHWSADPTHEQIWRAPDLHAILSSELLAAVQRVVSRAMNDARDETNDG
jgi:hypothetical protein